MKTGEKNNRPMLRIVQDNQITLLQNGEGLFSGDGNGA